MAALGSADGLQVHRSWWVAKRAVVRAVSEGRNLRLQLVNGITAPVARSAVAIVREAGWLTNENPPRAQWPFRVDSREVGVPVPNGFVCNDADVAIESCTKGLGLGSFLSYMVASLRKSGRLKYVLEDFEIEPIPGRAENICSQRAFRLLSSCPEEFHLQALPEPCMTLSSHTAPDVRPLP